MCGITGFYRSEATDIANAELIIKSMTDSLFHRGPDDSNILLNTDNDVVFGHRRLSILDTSKGGLQPMQSKSNNLVIVYNGEIYNHNDLRAEIEHEKEGIAWTSTSDTETLLAAFEHWGIEQTLPKLRGMFAIALLDKSNNNFYLIRDRFGEKPLYFGWIEAEKQSTFGFSSELKAFQQYTDFSNKISHQALLQYFTYMYVPCPFSIYENIYKLEPGCILKITSNPPKSPPRQLPHPTSMNQFCHEDLTISKWYDFKEVVEKSSKNLFTNINEATEALEKELLDVVQMQSLSDVPLGAFLSGGVDSSTIVALMQKQNSQPIKTFTIGFEDPEFNEAPYAEDVANHLQTDHSELFVTGEDAQSLVSDLPRIYDEPFADYSQIPTFFVCKSAKHAVTVSLSGDAGDELFGGYNRYLLAPKLWSKLNKLPKLARKFIGRTLIIIPISFWDNLMSSFLKFFKKDKFLNQFGDKVHKFSSRLTKVNSQDDLFIHMISESGADKVVLSNDHVPTIVLKPLFLTDKLPKNGVNDFASQMMYKDTLNYLTDDILCKVDRAAMNVSLETRVPFLDPKIVELAWRMPIEMKINGTEGKSVLRNILYKYVPKELIERPKAGFSIPLSDWLKGPLKDWADSLLDKERLISEGYLNAEYVSNIWNEHLKGKRNWTFRIWSILMFQSWLESTK